MPRVRVNNVCSVGRRGEVRTGRGNFSICNSRRRVLSSPSVSIILVTAPGSYRGPVTVHTVRTKGGIVSRGPIALSSSSLRRVRGITGRAKGFLAMRRGEH